MTYEDIINRIDSLPPLSNSAMLVHSLYASGAENVDIIKLVRIIESDALLTANILKMINAPFYGFSKRIASIAQAVSLFGTNTMYGLVLNYAMKEKIKANMSAYNISSIDFNEMCHLQSHLMTQWHSKIDLRHAQFLASLTLIMETGRLILSQEIADSSYKKEFQEGIKECENIEEYEYDLLETTSYDISSILFEHWNLEPLYVTMLRNLDFEDEYKPLNEKMKSYVNTLDVIRVAINVKEILTDDSIAKACAMVEDLNLDAEHFKKVAYRIKNAYFKKRS